MKHLLGVEELKPRTRRMVLSGPTPNTIEGQTCSLLLPAEPIVGHVSVRHPRCKRRDCPTMQRGALFLSFACGNADGRIELIPRAVSKAHVHRTRHDSGDYIGQDRHGVQATPKPGEVTGREGPQSIIPARLGTTMALEEGGKSN